MITAPCIEDEGGRSPDPSSFTRGCTPPFLHADIRAEVVPMGQLDASLGVSRSDIESIAHRFQGACIVSA